MRDREALCGVQVTVLLKGCILEPGTAWVVRRWLTPACLACALLQAVLGPVDLSSESMQVAGRELICRSHRVVRQKEKGT